MFCITVISVEIVKYSCRKYIIIPNPHQDCFELDYVNRKLKSNSLWKRTVMKTLLSLNIIFMYLLINNIYVCILCMCEHKETSCVFWCAHLTSQETKIGKKTWPLWCSVAERSNQIDISATPVLASDERKSYPRYLISLHIRTP